MSGGGRGTLLAVLGVVLLFAITPFAVVYAMEYQAVETRLPAVGAEGVTPYESLDPSTRTVVDEAHEGDGRWYRTRSAAPEDMYPVIYERDAVSYRVSLDERYRWSSWRAVVPFVTGAAGLVCVAAVARAQLRRMPGV